MGLVRTSLRRTQIAMGVILFASGCLLGLNCGGDSGGAAERLKRTYTDSSGKKFVAVVETTANSFGVATMLRFDAGCPNGKVSVRVPVSEGIRIDTVAASDANAQAIVANGERNTRVTLRCPGTGTRLTFVFDKAKIKGALGKLVVTTTVGTTTVVTTSPVTTTSTTVSTSTTTTTTTTTTETS